MEKKKISQAHMRATKKWDDANYDKILLKVPKGTKQRIISTGAKSINGFIRQAIEEKLDCQENDIFRNEIFQEDDKP